MIRWWSGLSGARWCTPGRAKTWKTTALLILLLGLVLFTDARALESVESGGIVFTYDPGEEEIVSRLASQAPMMMSFLAERGIPIERRIHVILDNALDRPEALVHMIPHSEIRIPLRAPGVLEEGYTLADPWTYFLFKGLCLHGLYSIRSKLPGLAHKAFGEIVSPNVIIPPWLTDGTCDLLYTLYTGTPMEDPFFDMLSQVYVPQDIAQVSNHPGSWPGYFAYRIYGRPFIHWLHARYGWEGICAFLEIHGSGIIPIEIDLKAKKAFGKTWAAIWEEFVQGRMIDDTDEAGELIHGYTPEPFVYWNVSGIYPGLKRVRWRSRYGYQHQDGTLLVSEYDADGITNLTGYGRRTTATFDMDHVWDPGPGGIAVTRKGSRPQLVLLDIRAGLLEQAAEIRKTIPSPPGALQLSGPVVNSRGTVAVAANVGGNWDIWIFDSSWHRVTSSASVEMDPWWDGDGLVFSSNISGTFQIHRQDLSQLTRCPYAAVLPRDRSFLCLKTRGWAIGQYENPGPVITATGRESIPAPSSPETVLDSRPYSPWESIRPNFIAPDMYAGPSDLQLGLVTWGRDVTGRYSAQAGFRYSLSLDYISWRAGIQVQDFGIGFSRYPLSYDPLNAIKTEESRHELRLFLKPHELGWLELSLHRLEYEPLEDYGQDGSEFWGAAAISRRFRHAYSTITAETYSGGRTSLFGSIRLLFGSDIYQTLYFQAGRTWGAVSPGHGTFRIGGDVGEGYFTQRASRLFALRGFTDNLLEADKALTSSYEVFWPVANIQKGYKTLPLFLHRLHLGTFIDAGACSERLTWDDRLIGAGIELVTSMEIAWGSLSSFRMGVAWPVDQPDYLDEKGPVFIIQVGRPL